MDPTSLTDKKEGAPSTATSSASANETDDKLSKATELGNSSAEQIVN